MKLSYIFSLLPLVAANDGYLYEDRHHLRRALTAEAEGVQRSCGYNTRAEAEESAACVCSTDYHCVTSCGHDCGWCSCTDWCASCVENTAASNDYEMVETGDGWEEDVDGDYILEEE